MTIPLNEHFTYNGDAQRLSETVNGAGTNYIIDANRSLFEVVQASVSSHYLHFRQRPKAKLIA